MRVRDLPIDPRVAQALEAEGYDELWPSQEEGAKVAAEGRNLVLAVPTASGKSLVAYIALLSRAVKGGKGLYLVPLRALAAEKHDDLKRLASRLGLRAALAIGDLDGADPQLAEFDVVIATSEKADALLRHRAHWLARMGTIVADEVHLVGDADRGPTLEVLLTRFRQLNPEAQLVALSATVPNSKEMARWLGAAHVASTWRPVALKEGIHFGKAIHYTDSTREPVQSELDDPVLALVEDAVAGGGQALVFVNNRRSTESTAEKLASAVKHRLSAENVAALRAASEKLRGGDVDTSLEKRLARCFLGGAAFHHAGLTNEERRLVETLFKEGHLKALAATPTLAAGINLPARRVIVRDLWRYDSDEGGNAPLPVFEYKQMAGRAGRPRYDKTGEAIVLAKTVDQRTELVVNYLLADPEPVHSKLGSEPALRSHLLSSIAAGYLNDEKGLRDFIRHTFFAEQTDAWHLDDAITRVLDFLLEHGFLVSHGDRLAATAYGKRTSELYIDPLSAVKLREALASAKARASRPEGSEPVTAFGWLHAACASPDMRNLFPRRTDADLEATAVERAGELLFPLPEGLDYEFFLGEIKTSLLLEDWIEERSEDSMVERHGVYPGDIRNKVDAAEWLVHAAHEIDLLFDRVATRDLSRLSQRLRAGAKEELLPLLRFRGVGRVRARSLFRAGLKGAEDLRRAALPDLERVGGIGPALARSIKRELGEEVADAPEPPATAPAPEGQQTLAAFGEPGKGRRKRAP